MNYENKRNGALLAPPKGQCKTIRGVGRNDAADAVPINIRDISLEEPVREAPRLQAPVACVHRITRNSHFRFVQPGHYRGSARDGIQTNNVDIIVSIHYPANISGARSCL